MTVLKLPALYNHASNGKVKQINISVRRKGPNEYVIVMRHGYVDGKQSINERLITEGKNIGRANETTPILQAVLEAKSRYQRKLDAGYRENIDDAPTIGNLPMLAHKYIERGHKIEWPAYVQPKLNGVRCLATKVDDNTISYRSRRAKIYSTLSHLDFVLLKYFEVGDIIDGEIFNPTIPFEEIISIVKNAKKDKGREKLQFWVYDFIPLEGAEKSFNYRYIKLADNLRGIRGEGKVILTPTYLSNDERMMRSYHKEFTHDGYEGTIIRNRNSIYRFTHRSTDLQKFKDFIDDEFEIIGGKEGTGKDTGTVIFRCKMKSGQVFDVRPKGSLKTRTIYWRMLEDLIGKMLTVRYQNLSDDKGIPIFPVGIGIRDYE